MLCKICCLNAVFPLFSLIYIRMDQYLHYFYITVHTIQAMIAKKSQFMEAESQPFKHLKHLQKLSSAFPGKAF